MDKNRRIYTKIWSDSWYVDLSLDESHLWLTLLLNERADLTGIFEIPMRCLVMESKIDSITRIREILDKFEQDGKVYTEGNWIIIRNYLKYQYLVPDNAYKALNQLFNLPDNVKNKQVVVNIINENKEALYKKAITSSAYKALKEDEIPTYYLDIYTEITKKTGVVGQVVGRVVPPPSSIMSSLSLNKNKNKKQEVEKETEENEFYAPISAKPVAESDDSSPSSDVKLIRQQITETIKPYLESPVGLSKNKASTFTDKQLTERINQYGYPKFSLMITIFYQWKCKTKKRYTDDNLCIQEHWVEERVAEYIKRNNGQLPEPPKFYSQEDVEEIIKLNAARQKQGIRLAKVPEVGSVKAS